MRRVLTAVLALSLLLALCACGGTTSGKLPGGQDGTETGSVSPLPEPGGKPAETLSPGQESGGAPTETLPPEPLPSGGAGPASDPPADEAALALLRQCMEGTGQVGAVAYLGYRDAAEAGGDLTDWLWTNVPGLMAEMPFLQAVSSDRVLNGGHGDLYCVVPRDESTSLAVNHVRWRSNGAGVWPETEEVLWRGDHAQPLLVFVRWEEFRDEPDVEVVLVADGGAAVTWRPLLSAEDGGYIVLPTGENGGSLLLDFSSFGDVTGIDYGGGGMFPPTELGLMATAWSCGDWLLTLRSGSEGSDYAGIADLSRRAAEGQEYQLDCSGVWRMEDGCLRLELSDGEGRLLCGAFPALIDLSGEHLLLRREVSTGAALPFFDDGADFVELALNPG